MSQETRQNKNINKQFSQKYYQDKISKYIYLWIYFCQLFIHKKSEAGLYLCYLLFVVVVFFNSNLLITQTLVLLDIYNTIVTLSNLSPSLDKYLKALQTFSIPSYITPP